VLRRPVETTGVTRKTFAQTEFSQFDTHLRHLKSKIHARYDPGPRKLP
jgi:hypothetical protein